MQDKAFLESYDGQSTDELIALENRYRVDSIVLAFEQALSTKDSPTAEERVVLTVEALEREVNNGGFSQFFENSSSEYTPWVVESLIAIDCPKTAELMRDAMDVLKIDDNSSAESIEDAVFDATESQIDQLSRLDDAYYRGDEEPISDKLFAFIKRNSSAISLPKMTRPD